jgi:hypothetical protein
MSKVIGETFDDFVEVPECVLHSIPSYEILEDGLVRMYVCKIFQGKAKLDHTDVATPAKIRAIGKRLLEIADEASRAPEVVAQSENRKVH